MLSLALMPNINLNQDNVPNSKDQYEIIENNEVVEKEEIVYIKPNAPRASQRIAWTPNGEDICTQSSMQLYPHISNDENGGAFFVWDDKRKGNSDIYAQRINSTGEVYWMLNGILVCNASGSQSEPKVVSDQDNGAIIVWEDYRNGNYDIYAMHINETGDINPQWAPNGTKICTNNYDQDNPLIVSDMDGGAIIIWQDERDTGFYDDIYAQRINKTGDVQWRVNGTVICNESNSQNSLSMVSDGAGGAFIAWSDQRDNSITDEDIYVQHINKSGDAKWKLNGTAVCINLEQQTIPQIESDGDGGCIIVWRDNRKINFDIYAQRVNSTGQCEWAPNGTVICNETDHQHNPQICSDLDGGAIITWHDIDICTQRINHNGDVQWRPNGTVICNETGNHFKPMIVSDMNGGAIIAWQDLRAGNDKIYAQQINYTGDVQWTPNGTAICDLITCSTLYITNDTDGGVILVWRRDTGNFDIFAQRIILDDNPPTSNSPSDIITTGGGTETIPWILWDDYGEGKYRVWSNNSVGNEYLWQIYDDWINNTSLDVPINRTRPGNYYYTIQYYDDLNHFGINHTVNVEIQNGAPTSDNPDDIVTPIDGGSDTINWTLYDDYGEGKYRVWSNDTLGNFYVWVDWDDWTNETSLKVPINRTLNPGNYNYTIEYYDDMGKYGNNDTVIVVLDGKPTSDEPGDITTSKSGSETINWTLSDDIGEGQYRVWANYSNDNFYVWVDWDDWTNDTSLKVPINRSRHGIFNYTIEYYDNETQYGESDSVLVTVTNGAPTSDHPDDIITPVAGTEKINWTIFDDFGGGQFRVLSNGTSGSMYVWKDWAPWSANSPFSVEINRTIHGKFKYILEFYDGQDAYGTTDEVTVTITNSIPTSTHPQDIHTLIGATITINWTLSDDLGGGTYRIVINGTAGSWIAWTNGLVITYTINTTVAGSFEFKIEYKDYYGLYGVSDVVIVKIIADNPPDNTDLIYIIIIGATAAVASISAVGVILVKKSKKKVREKDVEIETLKQQRTEVTEDDIILSKEKHFCLVHKGPIEGYNFICPSCGSYYCLKCVEAIKEIENECWSCGNSLDPSKPTKKPKEKEDIEVETRLDTEVSLKTSDKHKAPKKAHKAEKDTQYEISGQRLEIRKEPTQELAQPTPSIEPETKEVKQEDVATPSEDAIQQIKENIQKFDGYIEKMNNMFQVLEEKFKNGETSQDEYVEKRTILAEKLGEAKTKRDLLKEKLK